MKIIPGISTIDFRQSTFGIPVCVKNVPKYSTFDYRLSRYIFPKLLKKPKLLPECMGLVSAVDEDHSNAGQRREKLLPFPINPFGV